MKHEEQRTNRYNSKLYKLYKKSDTTTDIKLRKQQWTGYLIRISPERIPKNLLSEIQ